MKFISGEVYHVYNRGNQQQPIFFYRSNYIYFIKKMRESLLGSSEVLAYCLMPNHYHILLRANELGCELVKLEGDDIAQNIETPKTTTEQQLISRRIANLQSSYTRAMQKQQGFKGSLFQQKSKAKHLKFEAGTYDNYMATFLHYIHQNPIRAGLVIRMEDWDYSSFKDFAGLREGTLCNKQLALALADLDFANFIKDSYGVISDELIEKILY